MRRNMVVAQLTVFAAISVLVIGYAVFGLLHVRVTSRPFTVRVQLANAGGIFDGAEVAYRGVSVGKVSSVDLHTNGVTVTLSINDGTKIPDDAIAHIYDLSAVGEQYVDFEPPTDPSSRYLHGGSVIPRQRTTTPLETSTVLYDLEQFIHGIDPTDVGIIGREGALAFQDTGPQLRTILTDTTEIVNQLSSSEDSMLRLVHNARTLLRGAADHSAAFDRFAASLNALTGTIAAKTPTIDAFLRQAPATTQLVNSIIADNGSAVSTLLANLASLSQIQVARVPGLRALLVAVPEFGNLAASVVHDGTLLGVANLGQDQRLCNTGVPLSNPLSGAKTKVKAVHCGTDLVRGAANAPRPAGDTAPESAASTALGASAVPAGSGSEVGTYDPQTGLVSTSDGTLVRLGGTGGQTRLFGGNSWEALLLAGTGS
jgi:phospholipid/cholesterol/gamma-HCH transport system substrate-binding protein